eukprot:CAMPEP_0185845122 /NCGR_PEP_ID=MMETSP1354-20130828/1183_1 /TAXON_ID=708628 /ORGANISM="Erythrolobus madagascarensis, Strain CCMP3276" /LENGTH=137 /DNA_ID=CAMNT_0028545017 /DNA_START=49 /DNA_END=463 /DNA_ORIENTATION=+
MTGVEVLSVKVSEELCDAEEPAVSCMDQGVQESGGKEMVVDSTFDFERRRNRVAKYDRELMSTTLRAMKVIDRVRTKREKAFFKQRMKAKTEVERRMALRDLKEDIDLIEPAIVRERKAQRQAQKLKVDATLERNAS